jgi:membrane fusion protein, multidrug efflux system
MSAVSSGLPRPVANLFFEGFSVLKYLACLQPFASPFGVFPVIAGALLFLSACSSSRKAQAYNPGPVDVRAVAASSANVPLDVSAIGNVEALATVEVKPRVTGQVQTVNFKEGQNVRVGQILFELDQQPFIQAIHENEANLARDTALAAQARANVLKDNAQLKSAQAQADRAVALQKEGINSREATETVVATSNALQATLAADEAAVTSAEASLQADQARIDDAKLQLGYTVIAAPINGRAGAVAIQAGNIVTANTTTLVTILQVQPIYVTFSVPEQQLPEIRQYDAAHPLVVTASPGSGPAEQGKLRFIDNAVDTTSGTIKLKALFDNPKLQFWPGQFVNVKAQLALEPNRVVVPTQTVQTGPDGKYVWVVSSESSVSMRPVSVLREWGADSVIGGGLHPGEMVISEGQIRLTPGAKVRLLKQQAPDATASVPQPSAS